MLCHPPALTSSGDLAAPPALLTPGKQREEEGWREGARLIIYTGGNKRKLSRPHHNQEPPASLLFLRGWWLCLYSFEEIYLQVKLFILVNPLAKQIEPKLTKCLFRTELKANCVSFLF